jgi:hypothetical protein
VDDWQPSRAEASRSYAAHPSARTASTGEAAATHLPGMITLANELPVALVEKGLVKEAT